MDAVLQDLPQRGVVATDQQQETLDHLAALVLAEAVDRRLQAAQHVAADHLRVAAIAAVAPAGQLLAQRLHQLPGRLCAAISALALGRTVQGGKQRGHQVVVTEHHRRAAAVFAKTRVVSQDGVAKGPRQPAAVLADDSLPFGLHPRHAVEDLASSGRRPPLQQRDQRPFLDRRFGQSSAGISTCTAASFSVRVRRSSVVASPLVKPDNPVPNCPIVKACPPGTPAIARTLNRRQKWKTLTCASS